MKLATQNGFTLVELVLVTLIIAIMAAAMAPLFKSALDEKKLETTFTEVSNAFNFARSEARRTGQASGVCINNSELMSVTEMQTPNADLTVGAAQNDALRHPLNKQAYNLDFSTNQYTSGVEVNYLISKTAAFTFDGGVGASECVYFDASGVPHTRALGGSRYRLIDSGIELKYQGTKRTLSLQPMSGVLVES